MTRRRWIADEVAGNTATLLGAHADHLVRVLRARVGQEFDVATGDTARRGRIRSINPGRVEFELSEAVATPALANLTLVLSIFKFDRMEWAIEKCTELGVSRIIPAIARRTDAHLGAASAKRVERWRRIAREASEQSRRTVVPEIDDPIGIKEAAAIPGPHRVVMAESERDILLKDALHSTSSELVLAIGPEGGWTEQEIELFSDQGWISASLGKTILRAETAAIAATAIAVARL